MLLDQIVRLATEHPDRFEQAMHRGYGGGRTAEDAAFYGFRSEFASRATSNVTLGIQRVDYALTDFVLRQGPQTDVDIAINLMPIASIPKYKFTIPRDNANDLVRTNTERPLKAEFRMSEIGVDELEKIAKRYGYAYLQDRDTITNASAPWDVVGMATMKARRRVLASLDGVAADLAADNANFGLVISGDTWSVNGTLLTQITLAANYLIQATGRPKSAFKLALFNTALTAAQLDPLFLERRSKTQGATAASNEDIRAYLGVGSVDNYQPITKLTEESAASYLFPSDAILYFPGDQSLLGTYVGDQAWARTFRLLQGAAMNPWFEEKNTSWAFPFEMRELKTILDTTCAVKIVAPA